MTLLIKTISMKNFLSTGNVLQTVELNKTGINLVLGENLDLGGNGSRNGVGKSTILQAISYGLYGQSLTNIKVNNLINHINQKNMVVIVEFEVGGHQYKLERGRKPNFFKYIIDNKSVAEDSTDEAQGENRETQKEIDNILGMSHVLFKHIVALNTYTEPFLSLGAAKQREIIEELLGITQLSQKAENLKELIKATKTAIDQEEFQIKTIKQSNERTSASIIDIQRKADTWYKNHESKINEIATSIAELEVLDIDAEVQSHRDLEIYNQLATLKAQTNRDLLLKNKHYQQIELQLNKTIISYEKAIKNECPTCGQDINDNEHNHIQQSLEDNIVILNSQTEVEKTEIDALAIQLDNLENTLQTLVKPIITYKNLEQALNHRNTLEQLTKELEKSISESNPYTDQTTLLENSLQEITYDNINAFVKAREHQEFLLKLLTNKDSFIRKRIIDQNLAYLNIRLNEYLNRLGLPHNVKFINDLSVEISLHGQSLDFDNLSRGERTRLILGLSWSFRDIFENTTHAINLVFVDELFDAGLDPAGLEGSIEVLKKMERERSKNIFVISHREELVNRVTRILSVIKEDNFTRFDWDYILTI